MSHHPANPSRQSDSKGTDITDTIAEIKARIYFPDGRCHAMIEKRDTCRGKTDYEMYFTSDQCSRKPGYARGGLFCRQHYEAVSSQW
jgi:hypothetical protein